MEVCEDFCEEIEVMQLKAQQLYLYNLNTTAVPLLCINHKKAGKNRKKSSIVTTKPCIDKNSLSVG